MNWVHFVIFEIAPKYCILDSFIDFESFSSSSMWLFPTVVDIMAIWSTFNQPCPSEFTHSSLFTLTISCLTTFNLPWLMDLTFQVPMLFCSLQHWALLSPPDTSTTERHFCSGSTSSFLLELLLWVSSAAYWTPTSLGCLYFRVFFVFPFHTVHSILKARMLKWFAIPLSSGPCFIRTLHYDPSILDGPTRHGS